MDEFVRNQLTSLGLGQKETENLIKLFRRKGYNEEAYRKLTNRKLVELLPHDEDGEVAFKIMNNIRGLNNSNHMTGGFPQPSVIVKTEPLELDQTPAAGADDDVQIVGQTIRAPSSFRRVEIKQEVAEEQFEDIDTDTGSSSSTIIVPVGGNHNESDFTRVEIKKELHERESNGSSGDEDQPFSRFSTSSSSLPGGGNHNNGLAHLLNTTAVSRLSRRLDSLDYENWSSDYRAKAGQTRKRADTMGMEPQPKPKRTKRNSGAEIQWWKFIQSTLGQAPGHVTKAHLKQRFGDNLKFKLSAPAQLDNVLRLVETYSDRLSQFVKKLEITLPKPDDVISNHQIRRLASLPAAFLSQLTQTTFNLRFSENTDFSLITTLLSKCQNLTHFEVQRGVTLSGAKADKAVSLQVPKMDKLVSFCYAPQPQLTAYGKHYGQSPAPVDVESDKCAMDESFFQIEFANAQFSALEELQVGPFIDLEFASLSQFPKLTFFVSGYVSRPLMWLNDNSTCNSARAATFRGAMRMELIQRIPVAFANIIWLELTFPTANNLCAVIRKMSNMHIEYFYVTVNFEFESVLLNVLRGLPFRLTTEQDKLKFTEVQKYKHWKGFLQHLGIEFPTESSESSHCCATDGNGQTSTMNPNETPIGSFKFLKAFNLQHVAACVHLPTNDAHWNSPAVQVSPTRWSSVKPKFPSVILLEELIKLKGQLQNVRLSGFQVDHDTLTQFEQVMGFKISFGPWGPPPDANQDSFSRGDIAEDPSTRAIKKEK